MFIFSAYTEFFPLPLIMDYMKMSGHPYSHPTSSTHQIMPSLTPTRFHPPRKNVHPPPFTQNIPPPTPTHKKDHLPLPTQNIPPPTPPHRQPPRKNVHPSPLTKNIPSPTPTYP